MQKTFKRVLAVGLSSVMAVSAFSISAAAAYNPDYHADTHTVFRHTEQTLAPGVEQYTNYAYATDGEQNVYFVTTADISRDDVIVQTSYMDQYRDKKLGMSKLTDQVASANAYYSDPSSPQFVSEYYNVVAGVNASFYNMTTGQPTGICYIDGVDFGTNAYPAFFAILKDGTAVIDDRGNKGNYDIWQAVGGSQWIVRDGADVTASASGSYNTDRHCRTSVGITADGKVVTMALDGRQSPYSIGGSMHEIAQIMLEAGCVYAINLDGGGSTTYVAKQEGEDSVSIANRPSDGSERAISAGLIIASTAAPSDVFDHATLTAEDEYISARSSTVISAKGISPAGTSAEIPADAQFVTNNGTITADGTFTPATTGDATIQMLFNGAVVGETTVHVVVPDSIEFSVATLAAPYGKDADITMVAKYGEFNFNVKCDVSDYQFTLSDAKFGTVDGFVFHATNDTTVTGAGTITAVFVGSDRTATVPLTVGKGSETLFDFEDEADAHHTSRWSGYDGYNAGIVTTCTPVTAETGMVHSGNYAMAYDMDFTQLTYYEDYTYSLMCYNWNDIQAHGFTTDADGVRQRGATEDYVDITGATGLGMWMYIPDVIDVRGLDVRYTIGGKKTPTANWERVNSAMGEFFPFRAGLGTDGWYYYYFDLSNYSSWAGLRLQNCRTSNSINKNGKNSELYGDVMQLYVNDRAWKDADKQFKSYTSHVTLFIDDITVDYSSVVPDREAPVFTNPTYAFAGASDAMALNNNTNIAASEIEFAVSVAENTAKTNATGLNTGSVKAFVDGVETDAAYNNGKIAIPVGSFAYGAHTVTFQASDNAGNTSHITRSFNVTANNVLNTIKVVPRYADMTVTPVGSLYYIDIVATNVETVQDVDVTLKVNNVNDWEPQGIEAAEGFTASYTTEVFDKGYINLSISSTGTVNAAGEQVIASVPVRTWYPHNALGKNSNWLIITKKCVYPMDTQVFTKAGKVVFTDGTTSTFSAPVVQCDSEAMCEYGYIGVNKGNEGGTNVVTSWHEHNAQPMADKAATCTEEGYTGRTFCADCNSVIDWGTTEPATGHTYGLIPAKKSYFIISDNGINQSPDIEFNGGIGYWYDNGEYKAFDTDSSTNTITFTNTGNFANPTVYCWFEGSDGAVAWPGTPMTYIGENDYGQAQFTFEMPEGEKVLGCTTCGELFNGEFTDGKTYADGVALQGFVDGKYYIDGEVQPYTGAVKIDGTYYEFDENHVSVGTYTGLVTEDGVNYYSKFGELTSGWFEVDGDWYYFVPDTLEGANGTITNEARVPLTFENGKVLKGEWEYTIGKYRYWYGPTYYKLNSRNVAYLEQEVEGATYLFDEGGYRATGIVCNHESNARDLIWYDCGTDGKATRLTGPQILENNGKLYYVNEEGISPAGYGLVKVDGAYYYVLYNGTVKTNGERTVTAEYAHGLVSPGTYNFGADGKMTNAPIEYGIDENGFYRENGEIVPGKGLVLIDGDYYYVIYNGRIKKDGDRTVTEELSNGLLPAGTYHFGPDGKMTTKLSGIGEDGYYRENGVIVPDKGLIEIDGDYYYVIYNGKIKIDGDRTVTEEKANGLVPAGTYHFGPDGKMVLYPADGIGDDGFYREDGEIIRDKGLVLIDGDYYYVIYNGKIKKDGDRTVTEEKANGLVPAGTYHFGPDGKMVNPPAAN